MTDAVLQSEIALNFDYFQRMLASFLSTQRGRFALLHNKTVIGFFDTPGDADERGATLYADGVYSIQQVTQEPVELGLYANGLD